MARGSVDKSKTSGKGDELSLEDELKSEVDRKSGTPGRSDGDDDGGENVSLAGGRATAQSKIEKIADVLSCARKKLELLDRKQNIQGVREISSKQRSRAAEWEAEVGGGGDQTLRMSLASKLQEQDLQKEMRYVPGIFRRSPNGTSEEDNSEMSPKEAFDMPRKRVASELMRWMRCDCVCSAPASEGIFFSSDEEVVETQAACQSALHVEAIHVGKS